MRLEGTLDAFSLPDIFQLLSYTKKTGTLHLRREAEGVEAHGVVHLREGSVTGARSDVGRQALARRLIGSGLVDDDALEEAVSVVASGEGVGLAKVLSDLGAVDADALRCAAFEHANDAVFELLRWPDGDFSFVVDEADPDDLGVSVTIDDIVAEGHRRLEHWPSLIAIVPSVQAVVSVAPAPHGEPTLNRDEWALLSLVNGRRSVSDIVDLAGRGEYAVVLVLAALVERGLVTATEVVGEDPLARRQGLLAQLETPAVVEVPEPAPKPRAAAVRSEELVERTSAIPDRPEPFGPTRRPDYAEQAPAVVRTAASPVTASAPRPSSPASSVGAVYGSAALQPSLSAVIERDPSVNKSLLLRLIAGVRGL